MKRMCTTTCFKNSININQQNIICTYIHILKHRLRKRMSTTSCFKNNIHVNLQNIIYTYIYLFRH